MATSINLSASLFACCLMLFGLGSTRAAEKQPVVLNIPFYREAVAVPHEVLRELVDHLIALAGDFPRLHKLNPELSERALAVAWAIDPDLKIASGANSPPLAGDEGVATILAELWESAQRIHDTAYSHDEKLLALYLMAVIDTALAEEAPHYRGMRALLKRENFPGWDGITHERNAKSASKNGETTG